MSTWLLIITLITYDGVSVQQVGPFISKERCTQAANFYLKNGVDDYRKTWPKAVCVEQGSILD